MWSKLTPKALKGVLGQVDAKNTSTDIHAELVLNTLVHHQVHELDAKPNFMGIYFKISKEIRKSILGAKIWICIIYK